MTNKRFFHLFFIFLSWLSYFQGRVKGSVNKFKPIQDDPTEIEHLQDVLIVRIEEALFFANTGKYLVLFLFSC